MSYRVFGMVAAVSALALVLTACEKGSANGAESGAGKGMEVGVVDLDRVATDLRWLQEMETNLKTLEQQFKNELQTKQDQYAAEVQAKLKAMGAKEGAQFTPTPAQADELNQMVMVRRNVIGQLQQAASQQFAGYKGEWIKRYREALGPVVRDVASDKKIKVIITKTDTVMFVDNVADLTTAVTDAARARPPVLAPVPIPVLPTVPELPAPTAATQPAAAGGATKPVTPAPKK